jgi:hypothetical protein
MIALVSSRDYLSNTPTGNERVFVSSYGTSHQPLLEISYGSPSPPPSGTTNLYGAYNEYGIRNGAINITFQNFINSTITFELDGTTALNASEGIFRFDLGSNLSRTYYLKGNGEDIYVFKPEGYVVYYYFNIYDLLGIHNGYLESLINVNGTYRVVERWIVTQGITPFIMNVGHTYRMRLVCDEGTYIFGDYPAIDQSQTYTLTVTNTMFPTSILTTWKYIRIYASRTFGDPTGTITAHYEDLLNATISVAMTIKYANGTLVDSDTVSGDSEFNYVFSSLLNSTDYIFDATITHSQVGSMQWRQTLTHEYAVTPNPFSMDFLGSSAPIVTAYIIPTILILFIAGTFSVINRELGAFVAMVMAIFLSAMQWLPIPVGGLIAGVSFVLMIALLKGKTGQVIIQ